MIKMETVFPYPIPDNLFDLKDQPVRYNDKKIGKIIGVRLDKSGVPLLQFKVYKKYYNLIKDKI